MNSPTYQQIATDYRLWLEYNDPQRTTSEGEFEAMSVAEKVALLVAAHGAEANDPDA